MLRYAITNGTPADGDGSERGAYLHAQVCRWSAEGVDYVQLREKSLPAGALFDLAFSLAGELRRIRSATRLLINSRADVALAAGASGVHLTSAPGELTPEQVRRVFAAGGAEVPVISISCHSAEEAARAESSGANLILFGPVFEKVVQGSLQRPGSGMARLREASRAASRTPVLALGGVTKANTALCLAEGAAGIAGIRLFE